MNKEEYAYVQLCASEVSLAAESYFVRHGYPDNDDVLKASTEAIRYLLGVRAYDSIQAVRAEDGMKPLSLSKREFLEFM